MKRPIIRFAGAVLLAGIFAVAMVNGAKASNADIEAAAKEDGNAEAVACTLVMAPEFRTVAERHARGMEPALNRHLIRSEPTYGPAGRWLLLRYLDALVAGSQLGAQDAAWRLCGFITTLPAPPAASEAHRPPFTKPQDI